MTRSRRGNKLIPKELGQAYIESMSHDGRGVARINGKAIFVQGALPGEEVLFQYDTQRKNFDEGHVADILKPAPARVTPRCRHFTVCGGCSLQHMASDAQLEAKQQVLLDNLKHIGKLQPRTILPALRGPAWGYRRKARLGAKYVVKKEAMLVGFRERGSSLLADLTQCEVLHPSVGSLLPELRALLAGLDGYDRIPQIEVAVGDAATALVFRHLDELSDADQTALSVFGKAHDLQIYVQAAGPDSVSLLWPQQATLSYRLPRYDLELFFAPTDFTQVNAEMNVQMIDRVVELLDLQTTDRVLDLFCGLGNFTLPLARRAGRVIGVEGDAKLVQRARDNALHNSVSNGEFYTADLAKEIADAPWVTQCFDKILLDPPRTGALDLIKQLPRLGASRIVYVSCNPSTLARDAHELVQLGYELVSAGVMDMFPHTTHVESIALFERIKN
ncbi:MAG: 23S rRNA (uracil(1939)-C(5))-methyltransferase RlmD [Gammaproteobacteria bacterium]